MRIALISTYPHPVALGLRYVSSYLKAAGHDVEMFFMSAKRDTAKADFSIALLEDLCERLRSFELIGMSAMTNTFHRACVLTETIRNTQVKAPIVWGGVHPTIAPVESLEVPDITCVGEGEEPMRRLADRLEAGRDPTDIDSLSFRGGGPFGNKHVLRNDVQPLQHDLDAYPFPDYDLETHWVASAEGLKPARLDNLRGALHRLRVITTRGCPCTCSFCNNAVWLNTYKGKGQWVRHRSADNVIAEIRQAQMCFSTVEAVNIVDDLFFVRSEDAIEEFAVKYEQQVNLPLELDAFPNTLSETKLRSLSRVPIHLISMGIQSGSPDTLKNIYHRPTPLKKIVEGINLFADHKIRAEYHYIVNNPFETDRNRIETMRFAATHHRGPAVLRIFPLQLYPGTPLYARAREAGLVQERHDIAYRHTYTGKTHILGSGYLDVWLRVVLHLRNGGVPRVMVHRLIDGVTHPWTRRIMDRKGFVPIAYGIYQAGRFITRKLIYQPLIRPLRYLLHRTPYGREHPEDELTLPRASTVVDRPSRRFFRRGSRSKSPPPTKRWPIGDITLGRNQPRVLAKE